MIDATQFEDRASSSRGTHEGESSQALCDRLSRTRDSSQRQLPTDHDHAVPTREYQTDQSSLKLPRLPLALSLKDKNHPTAVQRLTGSLHIRAVFVIHHPHRKALMSQVCFCLTNRRRSRDGRAVLRWSSKPVSFCCDYRRLPGALAMLAALAMFDEPAAPGARFCCGFRGGSWGGPGGASVTV